MVTVNKHTLFIVSKSKNVYPNKNNKSVKKLGLDKNFRESRIYYKMTIWIYILLKDVLYIVVEFDTTTLGI